MQLISVTSKGQVTIPQKIREKMGIKPGDKVFFEEDKNGAKVQVAPDFFSFRGALKGKKLATEKEIERAAAKEATERYLKTFK